MTEDRVCPVVDFDHHTAAHAADPVGAYQRLREHGPVVWTEAYGGFFVLTNHETVFDAARDDDLFSSGRHEGRDGLAIVIPEAPFAFHIPIEMDPPEFRSYREVLNKIISPRAMGEIQPTIDKFVTGFIDEIIETGEADLAFVAAVPAAVTVDWLGMDASEYKRYVDAMHTLIAEPPGSEQFIYARDVAVPWVEQTVRAHIAARREQPSDDATSALLAAEVNGAPMTDDEVYSMLELLITGGVSTTAALVTSALVWLSQHLDERQRLRDDPSLLPAAIEEFLRVFSPTQALARTVTRDTTFHGCPMQAGDRVLMSWASANRDPAQFDDPDELDLERRSNRHTAFGVGIHRCAGSHVARAMAVTTLGQILERLPDHTVDLDGLVTYPDQGLNTGYKSVPARFTPGERRAAPLWGD